MTKIPSFHDPELAELIAVADTPEFIDGLGATQRTLVLSYIEQYEKTKSLSDRQKEILSDIVEQYRPTRRKSKFGSRRYEGFGGGGRR